MGFSIAWVAFRGLPTEVALNRLSLRETGRNAEYAKATIAGHRLTDDWFLIVAKGSEHSLISSDSLSSLSQQSDVLACSVSEHVMFSSAEFWKDGTRVWRIEHDAEESTRHLLTSGAMPEDYQAVLQQITEQQDSEDAGPKEVDFFFDVPLQVAYRIAGFKHDEIHSAINYEEFSVYESSNNRRWWQLWR
jgi:hypothetical protein